MIIKRCLFCNEEFVPKSNRQLYCNREHWRYCPSCGKAYIEKFSENLSKPPRLCSPRCGSTKSRELPKFIEIVRNNNYVIIDSTVPREKYDNLTISKYYRSQKIRCIHMFPNENIDRLAAWCNINKVQDASEFKIYKLNLDYAAEFLEENDIVKFNEHTSVALGLVKNYTIFQVLTFSPSRHNKKYDYELLRYCSKNGYQITGGLDALSSAASLLLGVSSCVTYLDLSKGYDDTQLRSIGMKIDHINTPHCRPSGCYDCGTEVLTFQG